LAEEVKTLVYRKPNASLAGRGGEQNITCDLFDIPFNIYKKRLRKTLTMKTNPE
jgi:hypothetical protein